MLLRQVDRKIGLSKAVANAIHQAYLPINQLMGNGQVKYLYSIMDILARNTGCTQTFGLIITPEFLAPGKDAIAHGRRSDT